MSEMIYWPFEQSEWGVGLWVKVWVGTGFDRKMRSASVDQVKVVRDLSFRFGSTVQQNRWYSVAHPGHSFEGYRTWAAFLYALRSAGWNSGCVLYCAGAEQRCTF